MEEGRIGSGSTHPSGDKAERQSNVRRDLLLGVGGFVLFILLSAGLLTVFSSSGSGWTLFERAKVFATRASIEITLIHTNDTWGYLEPCG